MRWLPSAAVLVFTIIFQSALSAHLELFGAPPDFVLTGVLLTGLAAGAGSGGLYGVAAGLCLDVWRGHQIGLMALAAGSAGWLAGTVGERVYPGRASVRFLTVAAGTVLAQAVVVGLYRVTSHGAVAWTAVEHIVAVQAVYNGLIGVIAYPLFVRIRRGRAVSP